MPRPLTFIRAAETWVPSADGSMLVAAPNSFGAMKRLEGLGRAKGFARDDGLPGRAWEQGRPVLMRELDASYFQRIAGAQEAGVTSAIAIPIFLDGSFKAVVVIFFGHVSGRPSALEIWRADALESAGMTLVDGTYDAGSQAFELASRAIVIGRGEGLPGMVWQRGEILFVESLPESARNFKRAEQAGDAGLQRGLAIPFGSRSEGGYVVSIMAGVELPLSLAIERWEPDRDKKKLIRSYAYRERHGGTYAASAELALDGDHLKYGVIANAFSTGIPCISDNLENEANPTEAMASDVGASALLAIPVVWGGSLIRGVLALYF